MESAFSIPGITLGNELGHGSYSVVYRAKQGDDVSCAVKVPKKKDRLSFWLYREAVALARVRHPNLPAVMEVGDSQGVPYVVMELVEGETLAERIERTPLSQTALVDVAISLASALAAVHDANLIHRDVKPRNIIVEPSGRVRLVDFGFASPMERSRDGAGTPDYAAPEQLYSPSRTDGRADLYALGRVLFECATQSLPDRKSSERTQTRLRTELLDAAIDEGLTRVILGLVAYDAEDRYADARAVLSDLERVKNGQLALGPAGFEATRAQSLVGYSDESERVLRMMGDLATLRGAVAMVRGGRGTGKSAFIRACASSLRNIVGETLPIACYDGDPPLSAIRRLFESHLDWIVRRDEDDRAEATRALLKTFEHLEPLAALISPRLTTFVKSKTVAPASPEMILEGVSELLVRLGRASGALVVTVDDVQWMDAVSRAAFARVIERLEEVPLGLMLGTRAAADDLEERALRRAGRAMVLDLKPLTQTTIGELVANHLGVDSVDTLVVQRVATLADGTPLGVLEVLGSFLDAGALRPRGRNWQFDPAAAGQVELPEGALVLLGRRVQDLPEATRTVLSAASVLGTVFEDKLLAGVIGVSDDDLGFAVAGARRAGILERAPTGGGHRFLHDSLREMLLADLHLDARRNLHQAAAELLDDGSPDPDRLYRAAAHFESGVLDANPARAYQAVRSAADRALERFDNEAVIRLMAFAVRAAELAKIVLDAPFYTVLGEAHLRRGETAESIRAFDEALTRAPDRLAQASTLGRIGWVHHTRGDAASAWTVLDRAFVALGEKMPTETVTAMAHASVQLARYGLRNVRSRKTRDLDRSAIRRIELLCELHYQNFRLGLENEKPLRFVQSAVEMIQLTEDLPTSKALARAVAVYGFVSNAISKGRIGPPALAMARQIALDHGDPSMIAFCIQFLAVGACLRGEFESGLEDFRVATEEYGSWLELNELCANLLSGELIETVRGRSSRAHPWLTRAVERIRRAGQASVHQRGVFMRIRASNIALGRELTDPWLTKQVATAFDASTLKERYQRTMTWGARLRVYAETGDIGTEFENLVRAFEAEKHDPKTAYQPLLEVYITIAHARIHQALRDPAARSRIVPLLRKACKDLTAAANVPLFKAHALYAEGCLALFTGDRAGAQSKWGAAEALAIEQICPWVLYGVARVRAHMLKENGHRDGWRDQARLAELFATEHGAVHRARFIREEFGSSFVADLRAQSSMNSRSSRLARRQLAAIFDVLRLPRSSQADPKEQASKIVDEVLRHVEAERGIIWFQPPTRAEGVRAARTRQGVWQGSIGWPDALVRAVQNKGEAWPHPQDQLPPPSGSGDRGRENAITEADPQRVVAIPLFVRDAAVGAIFIERAPSAPPFSSEDRALIDSLSQQVPVALELNRLLAEHEKVQASLEHTQRLESLGRLAGGLAHDFNNMLLAIQGSASVMRDQPDAQGGNAEDLDVILEATDRATKLTRQLLSFSRHKGGQLVACKPHTVIQAIVPMLKSVLGSTNKLILELSPDTHDIRTDHGQLEQAIVNLVINARDAINGQGAVTIKTRNVTDMGDELVARGGPRLSDAVVIEISDTGSGMTDAVLSKIFEPFFSTKEKGTGLGLATLYAFVKTSGGHVIVDSEIGRGTTFSLYFARGDAEPAAKSEPEPEPLIERKPVSRVSPVPIGTAILLVDDNDSARNATRRILEGSGYKVLDASSANDAYTIVQERRREVGLMIVDVRMPGTTGPELVRSLRALDVQAKVIFVSGFVPANDRHDIGDNVLLEKPFSKAELLNQVEVLLPTPARENTTN